jgi:hypothetical protein
VKAARLSRTLHKWFALVVGLQFLLWTASGFYMVAVNIDLIHGDMLVRNMEPPPQFVLSELTPAETIIREYPQAHRLILTTVLERAVYRLDGPFGRKLVDAKSGDPVPSLNEQQASDVARHYYAGDGAISNVELITTEPPGEVRFLTDPVWRVDFDDLWGSTFYVDPGTGHFITRRHTLWRVFDFLWMLHIMDYETRDDINNTLLTIATIVGLSMFAAGAWLLYFAFGFGRRRAQ